jgi:hypothetical protein
MASGSLRAKKFAVPAKRSLLISRLWHVGRCKYLQRKYLAADISQQRTYGRFWRDLRPDVSQCGVIAKVYPHEPARGTTPILGFIFSAAPTFAGESGHVS